jgi:hypothetical protein
MKNFATALVRGKQYPLFPCSCAKVCVMRRWLLPLLLLPVGAGACGASGDTAASKPSTPLALTPMPSAEDCERPSEMYRSIDDTGGAPTIEAAVGLPSSQYALVADDGTEAVALVYVDGAVAARYTVVHGPSGWVTMKIESCGPTPYVRPAPGTAGVR